MSDYYEPTLFDAVQPLEEPPTTAKTVGERFAAFHALNPWVYDRLVEMTYEFVARGHRRVGLRMFFEVLRWQAAMGTISADEFRLNDHYISRYARLIVAEHPDLEGIFELRTLKVA